MKSLHLFFLTVLTPCTLITTSQPHTQVNTHITNEPKVTLSVTCGKGKTKTVTTVSSTSTRSSHCSGACPQTPATPENVPPTNCAPTSHTHTTNIVNAQEIKQDAHIQAEDTIQTRQHNEGTKTRSNFDDELGFEEALPAGAKPIYTKPSQVPASWTIGSSLLFSSKLVLATAGIGYSAVLAKMLYTSYVSLAQDDTWSSWKQNIPVNLLNSSQSQLAQELFADIQVKYANAQHESSLLTPLVQFYNDVDAEMEQFQRFIQIHDWLSYLKIAVLFPAQHEALQLAAKKIKRLEHLKKLVIKSIAEYKVSA